MAITRLNRRGCVAGLLVASALGATIAVGAARWPDMQFELGYAYENGHFHGWTPGFSQDHRQAANWLSRAAEADHPRAQYMLGILHAHGWGVPRDSIRALEWFTRSASNGYAPACYHLGWMYHQGEGAPRNNDLAINLLEQAAGQGMAAAQLALGRFYARGEGVPQNGERATKWHALALHSTRFQPELFDNAAFAERSRSAYAALSASLAPSSAERDRQLARRRLPPSSKSDESAHRN